MIESDIANGLGIRTVIWLSGCDHHCKGCFNSNTWSKSSGKFFDDEAKAKLFDSVAKPYTKGLTLSGGDPLIWYDEGLIDFLEEFRAKFGNTKDIWLYSGYVLKEIEEKYPKVLPLIDYVVDGEFVEELHDARLAFRGSSNQVIWEKKDGVFVKSKLND